MATVEVPANTESGVRAYDGQDKAADRLLRTMERRAKLLGLDAPTQVTVRTAPDFAGAWEIVALTLTKRHPSAAFDVEEALALWERVGGGAIGKEAVRRWLGDERPAIEALPAATASARVAGDVPV